MLCEDGWMFGKVLFGHFAPNRIILLTSFLSMRLGSKRTWIVQTGKNGLCMFENTRTSYSH